MHIEVLTEDKSGALVVRRLINLICEDVGCQADISMRPHRGCGSLPRDLYAKPPRFASSLLDLLPAKCRAYNNVYKGTDTILVVIMDSDDNDTEALKASLEAVCAKFAGNLRAVIGISTEEIESWLLGDHDAIEKAYPDFDREALRDYVQDSVCGTWETLCRVVCPDNYEDIMDIGYPAVGNYKARWADAISRYMTSRGNVSPSYENFRISLERALKKPVSVERKIRRTSF